MRIRILTLLQNKAEEKYREFSGKLLPNNTALLGVRIPIIRELAKQIIKENKALEYLNIPLKELKYQEELMLYSMLVANIKETKEEKIIRIKNFVPYINSWAVCDIFSSELKCIKKDTEFYYKAFQQYIKSKAEYQIRFFYVIALNYFLTHNQLQKLFNHIATQKYVGFYDKMAVAWLISIAYTKFPEATESFMFQTPLDKFIFRKSISKICDSFRVTKEAKQHLRQRAKEIL